jgi:peptide deformylase
MAIRKIALIGHPVLRQHAEPVSPQTLASASFQQLIDDLIETMRDASGAGIAANQVHEPVSVCVVEVRNNVRYPYKPSIPLTVLVNPKIEPLTEETFPNYEGCLSVPNLRGVVKRVAKVRVTALDRDGAPIERIDCGFTAGTMQHETDHLIGKLFLDRVDDHATLCTWDHFERYHRQNFVDTVVTDVVARWHPRDPAARPAR